MAYLFIGLVLIIFIAPFFLVKYLEKRRTERVRAWAQEKGFEFLKKDERDPRYAWPGFALFRRGHSGSACNFVRFMEDGVSFQVMDYTYEEGSGKNKSTITQSVFLVETGWPLRELTIRPEGLFDKVAAIFRGEDLQFESPEFNRRFFVKSPDPGWATEFVHPAMIDYLLTAPKGTLEVSDGRLLVYAGRVFAGDQLDLQLEHVRTLIRMVPEALREPPAAT